MKMSSERILCNVYVEVEVQEKYWYLKCMMRKSSTWISSTKPVVPASSRVTDSARRFQKVDELRDKTGCPVHIVEASDSQ